MLLQTAPFALREDIMKHGARLASVTSMEKIVLLVEDNSDDVFLLREALALHSLSVRLLVLEDGEKAIDWIQQNDLSEEQQIAPLAVILDLNLPKRNGAEVLDVLRASQTLSQTPVIIFSSSNTHRDRALRDRYPHTSYLRKSADFDEFANIGGALKKVIDMSANTQ
jgi:DNA-binding response OmpR family regulator